MSYFDETLFLLKEGKEPKSFISDLNKKLNSINVVLQRSDYVVLVFNDCRNEEEKEPIWLDNSTTEEEVVDLICSWKGLGLLTYRHPDFRLEVDINYLTWDDKHLRGFALSFAGSDMIYKQDIQKKLISEISEFVDYEYIVGDISNVSKNYIRMEESLDKIKEQILNNTFEIDSRTW